MNKKFGVQTPLTPKTICCFDLMIKDIHYEINIIGWKYILYRKKKKKKKKRKKKDTYNVVEFLLVNILDEK